VCWLIICFTLCVLFSSSSSRVLSFCLWYSVLVLVFLFFSVFLSLCSLQYSSVFFFLSLPSSSSLVRPLGSILFVYVSWFLSWVLSVFPFFSLFFVRGFLFFLCYLWFLASPVRSLGFYPLSSSSVPPDSPSSSPVLLSTVFALFCYFPGILSSLLRFFVLFLPLSFPSFFSVLVPSLHFSFTPLCASPVFSLFGWFASVFSSSSLGFFCSWNSYIAFTAETVPEE